METSATWRALSPSLRRPTTMAAFMLTASPATAPVARVAATGRAPAQRVSTGVTRRNVAAAAKKSVGDLTEADLKGKARYLPTGTAIARRGRGLRAAGRGAAAFCLTLPACRRPQVVFERADLNVPLDKDLNITDDTRIRAAIPTLEYLVSKGAKVMLTSHLVCAPPTLPETPTSPGSPRARPPQPAAHTQQRLRPAGGLGCAPQRWAGAWRWR